MVCVITDLNLYSVRLGLAIIIVLVVLWLGLLWLFCAILLLLYIPARLEQLHAIKGTEDMIIIHKGKKLLHGCPMVFLVLPDLLDVIRCIFLI